MPKTLSLLAALSNGEPQQFETLCEALTLTKGELKTLLQNIAGGDGYGVELCEGLEGSVCLQTPLKLLGVEKILNSNFSGLNDAPVTLLSVTDSTNEIALDSASSAVKGSAWLAEYQQNGRGRRGKSWTSPYATNIYLSILWHFKTDVELGGLSLAIGVAVAQRLTALGLPNVQLKWPNDVYIKGVKVGGLLIEAQAGLAGQVAVVVGLGLNVKMPVAAGKSIDQSWTDLETHLNSQAGLKADSKVDRNELAGALISDLRAALVRFEREGFTAFYEDWQRYDCCFGQQVEVKLQDQLIIGTALSVAADGALVLATIEGEKVFYSGEVSLRVRV